MIVKINAVRRFGLHLTLLLALGSAPLVHAQDSENAPPTEQLARSESDASKPLTESLFDTSDDKPPLLIKSKTLSLDAKNRTFTYEGNVEVVRADLTITSSVMVGEYDDKNRIRTITCKDNVVITKGADMTASSNRAVYNVLQGTIELTEGPELINRGNALTADKVTIFVEEDRSEAEGDVRVRVIKTEGEESKSGGAPFSDLLGSSGKRSASVSQ